MRDGQKMKKSEAREMCKIEEAFAYKFHFQDYQISTFKTNGISERNKFHHKQEGGRDVHAGSHSFTFLNMSLVMH